MTYRDIPDSEIDPGSPITNALMTALRDNLEGAFDGDSPFVINRAAVGSGSSGLDGPWDDGTSVTGLGFFEPESIHLTTTGLLLPGVSIIRVDGDVTIAAGVTMDIDTLDATDRLLAGQLGQILGTNAVTTTWGEAQPLTGTRYFWNRMRGIVGGQGGLVAGAGVTEGGGVLILIIDGDLTLGAGAKIRANGMNGTWTGVTTSGGGGGGTIIVVCTGTISGGTYEANGGNGWDLSHGPGSGAGGGGYVALVAAAYGTAPTLSAVEGSFTLAGGGGGGGGGGSVGSGHYGSSTGGLTEQVTLTEPQIRSLLLRSY